MNVIAFRRFSQMDISGNVVVNSSMDHINTLKVGQPVFLRLHCDWFTVAVFNYFFHVIKSSSNKGISIFICPK